MKAPVAFPFLRAAPDRISAIQALRPEARDDLIPDWDPNTDVGVSVQARIDRRGVLSDCGLAADALLAASLTWRSPGTYASGVLRSVRLDSTLDAEEIVLSGSVPGAQLAHFFDLSLTLHLAASVRQVPGSMAPWLVGSVLWDERRRYFVEGDASRFPIETRDFSLDGLLPKDAAWHLEWSPTVPTETFLGSVRLYLNVAHPMVQRLTERQQPDEPEGAEVALVRSILRADVARQLITGSLASEAFLESKGFEQGSVGYHVTSMLGQLFPGKRLSQLVAELRDQPNRFETVLQDRLNFLRI